MEAIRAPGTTGALSGRKGFWIQLLALAIVLGVEFALYQRQVLASAGIYPRWYDQVQYLAESYRANECRLDHGLLAGLRQTLLGPSEQGTLHGFWALGLFSWMGPSRAAALDVNLIWFLALQAATFLAVRRTTRSGALAWISVAVLLSLACPWADATGSVRDFRLDWMAACAYGVAVAVAVATGGIRSTWGSFFLGLAVALVLLTRFLSGVYFVLVFGAMVLHALCSRDRWARLARVVFSGAVAAAIAAPFYWINRQTIYNYYWIGHVTGPERQLRDSHLGFLSSAGWLASELLFSKVGVPALAIGATALGALWLLGRKRAEQSRSLEVPSLRGAVFMAALFLAAPALVLLVHPVKAPQTLSILLAPSVWLLTLGCARLSRSVPKGWLTATALGVGLAAAGLFLVSALRRPFPENVARDARKVNALQDYVFFRSEECGLLHPRLGVTLMAEGLSADAFAVLGYERHGRWLNYIQTLPTGLFETEEKTVMERLSESDFVLLLSGAESPWPFDRQMMGMLGTTRPWCDGHLRHVADLQALGFSIAVYERPSLARPGGAGAADLNRMLLEEGRDRAFASPPAAPFLVSPQHILWSVGRPFHVKLKAAYSPVRFEASGLAPGLSLDSRTGELTGLVQSEGRYDVQLKLSNPLGEARTALRLSFGNGAFLTTLSAPQTARPDIPAPFVFEAYQAAGMLDFIDITDLTARKVVARLKAPEDGQWGWQGTYPISFSTLGTHRLLVRFVGYDPNAKEPYFYADQLRDVTVCPK